jgi:hypothetical protein
MQEARVWLAANPWAWQLGLAVLAGLLVARILFRVFFDGWDDLREAMRLDAQSDWLSLLRGELFEDWRQSARLGLYVMLSGGAGVWMFCWLQRVPVKQ